MLRPGLFNHCSYFILLICHQHRAHTSTIHVSNSGDITLITLYVTIYYYLLPMMRIKSLTLSPLVLPSHNQLRKMQYY